MARNDTQILLLFILLISALGCYCAFSKQVTEEEGLSKLKMISSRNLKGNKSSANKIDIDDNGNGMGAIVDNILQYNPENADNENDENPNGLRSIVDNIMQYNPVYADNDMRTIFNYILQINLEYADRVKQMCQDTVCTTVEDDQACVEAMEYLGSTMDNPICGSCDGTKCTYGQAPPEVVTEQESIDTEETIQVTNEVSN